MCNRGKKAGLIIAGICAGAVNGLFGGGGGMLLVPLLTKTKAIEEEDVFSSSVAIILPICIISLMFSEVVPLIETVPYLFGGLIGGIAAGLLGKKIPVLWLHKGLGVLILWGGIRYLCNG